MKKLILLSLLVILFVGCTSRSRRNHVNVPRVETPSKMDINYDDFVTHELNGLIRPVILYGKINGGGMIVISNDSIVHFRDCSIVKTIVGSYNVNDTILR